MREFATKLFPICRSITGDGVRQTLVLLSRGLAGLVIREVSNGTKVLDWHVPDEWNITGGYLEGSDCTRTGDFADGNLRVFR